jgi:hypothetical protein
MDADGDPDLSHDGIARYTQEALYLQVLLELFVEQFELSTCLVHLSDGTGSKLEVVGQKIVLDAGFGIL